MTALDVPVAAVNLEKALGAGFPRRSAGDAVNDVVGVFPALLLYEFPLDYDIFSKVGGQVLPYLIEFGNGLKIPGLCLPD